MPPKTPPAELRENGVPMTGASERSGVLETAMLLRAPENARRLHSALLRAETAPPKPMSIRKLRREILGYAP